MISAKDIEKKRYRLEVCKIVLTFLTIIIAFIGAYNSYQRYIHDKEKDRNSSYKNNIALLGSEDLTSQKIALQELSQYPDKFDKLAPILIDFMITQKLNGNNSLDPYLITIFLNIGRPAIEILLEENINAQNSSNSNRLKVSQWAIGPGSIRYGG